MAAKRISKKFLKVSGLIIGSFLVLLIAFHFWFVYHAEKIIQDLVASRSDGKIRLDVENFKFNWFSKKMELENAAFFTTDSATAGTSYRFSVPQIKLSVKAVYPLLFENKVLINKLSLQGPDIVVTRLRSSKDSTRSDKSSIPQEMGRIYKSIQDALKVLSVDKFEIENARFTLLNKIQPDQLPVTISRIDFHIDNLEVDTSQLTGREKIFFSDNVVFKSRDQAITFPDGRHKLSYRKFRINIEKKIVEIDSCTVSALPTDSASSDFSIFFDELVMTNIDFDTLYRAEVIKADSVYCVNPQFRLHVNLDKRNGGKRGPPKLDEIIRQLTGDLMLNFVVVNNASFDITTLRNGIPNSYSSEKNNFEMQGLRIDNDAERPLRVSKFALAIRNYENFLRDSVYKMQFDSVLFNDDKILLSDFTFRKVINGKTINSFKVPRFQMTGLSWDDLLFDQKLRARQATLFNPEILFTENTNKKERKKNRNIFEVLASINEVIMLEDLDIINGNIDLRLSGGVNLNLKQATLSVETRSLLESDRLASIRRSVNYLDFKKGELRINDLLLQLDNIRYAGVESRLIAGKAYISSGSGAIHGILKGVVMDEILINEYTGDVSIGNIYWSDADIKINNPLFGQNKNASAVSLNDIHGRNTKLQAMIKGKNISAFFDELGAIAFLSEPGEKPLIAGLNLRGKELKMTDSFSKMTISSFMVEDLDKSTVKNFEYNKTEGMDSLSISIPELSFIPNIQQAMAGEVRSDEIVIHKPVVNVFSHKAENKGHSIFSLPLSRVKKLIIRQPELNLSIQSGKSATWLQWNGKASEQNSIQLLDITAEDPVVRVGGMNFSINNFVFTGANGKKFDAGQGQVTARLSDLLFNSSPKNEPAWKATLNEFQGRDFIIDSIGRQSGRLVIQSLGLKDLIINSSDLLHPRQLIKANKTFILQQVTGEYTDVENRFQWFNAGYNKNSQLVSLDSFSYSPTPPKEVFVASRPYQTDYLQIKTGAIDIGPFDIDSYLVDTVIRVGRIRFNDVVLNDFRDRRPPFRGGIIKPLMVNRIKTIPVKIAADSLIFNNADITYAELNPKTNQTGIITFNNTTLKFFPVRNFNFSATDSLRIHANGYLMDSIWVRLRLKESYTDSLSGFLLTLRMKPAELRLLNPVLTPLASARLRSGRLDSLSMRVAGGEYMAYGEIKMNYHDLNIEILRNGTDRKKGFLTMLANSFIIRNKNEHRTASVFYIRNREKSPINYLIKILMSGVNSSIGAKSNRKVIRQYKKELRQRNLPPVDYD